MWIVGRALSTFAVFIVVSMVLFAITHATPISPARIVLGADATDEQMRGFEHEHGLDRSLPAQYAGWVGELAHGGFGRSIITKASIDEELAQTAPVTLELVSVAFVLALGGAVLLGTLAAFAEDSALDHVVRALAMAALSVPGFWLGLILIRIFAVKLGWFPPLGIAPLSEGLAAHLRSLVLPALAIAVYYAGALSRLTRATLIEVLGQDYIRTSRSLGLSQGRLVLYALKNALPPVVSVAAMSFGYMFGWAIIVELVFNIPGLSRALLSAIFQRDYPMIQGTVLVITAVFILSNLVADLLQRALNPKLASA